ncbi:MAG: EVE domain-containing protein [Verrucomicrobiales bacterium]|nr:EVE domain-containing protein [Verrucomicrobiales bacterium]MCP5525830.1 EVE domain-containing protein [Verrucomicrobiales bacterium]
MGRRYWLVKEEPESLAWEAFVRDGGAAWTGVRNYQARNHLRTMQPGDRVFYYHSGKPREIVGIAEVRRRAYPDPTAPEADWSAVDLTPLEALPQAVTLAAMKADPALENLPLLRQSRLSVVPVSAAEWRRILELGGHSRSADV